MPNRRLPDPLLLLASALLELAPRPRPRSTAVPGRRRPGRLGASALGWAAAFAATTSAAAARPADLASDRVGGRALDIACPARTAAWPGQLLAPPAQEPAAGRGRHIDPVSAGTVPSGPAMPGDGAPPAGERTASVQPLRASFYRGDPRALDVLSPAATHRKGDVETSTWDFAQDAAMPVWIACVYSGDEVLATRPLPAGTRACTARLRITPMGDPTGVLAVSCQ